MIVAATLATARPVAVNQRYIVTGKDTYHIGAALPTTHIAYAGTQRLTILRTGSGTQYRARVRYTKTDSGGATTVHASFVQILLPDGSFTDSSNRDPDFLTILNQPFAVTLDPVTLRAIERLRGKVPFQANSPLGHSTLVGFLRPGVRGLVDGHPVVGVAFEANGPMVGGLPQRSSGSVTGTIRMDGTAYYATHSALLLALDARLTITGTLQSDGNTMPMHIVYHRSIRAYSTTNRSKSGD
ncbi:MAG: hypothetical protein ACYDGM_01345 [Vulcanimicrobiaceae bacterium]